MRLGKYQRQALEFAEQYHGWHTYAKDTDTERIIGSLSNYGLIEINQYHQFRLVEERKTK